MKYGEFNMGQAEALINNLGGMEIVRGILSGKLIVEIKPKYGFGWIINLGIIKNLDDFLKTWNTEFNNPILGHMTKMLNKIQFNSKEELELIIGSVAELGFEKGATLRDICNRVKYLGFDFFVFKAGSGDYLDAFGVLRYKDLYDGCPDNGWILDSLDGNSDHFCDPDIRFVLRLRKRS
jgi:hypothetical protein